MHTTKNPRPTRASAKWASDTRRPGRLRMTSPVERSCPRRIVLCSRIRLMGGLSASQLGHQLGGPVDLAFGVVVMRGEPDQRVDAAVLGVERVLLGQRVGDVYPGTAHSLTRRLCP